MPDWPEVVCPSCFERFAVPPTSRQELPSQMDYDCEVCCRPMVLCYFEDNEGNVVAEARRLDD